MPVLAEHRFNVQDYYRLAETGVLRPDARLELLEGRIIERSLIGPPHGGVVNRLSRILHQLAPGHWLVTVQNPLRLGDYSEPEPDLLLLRESPTAYGDRHPRPEDVYLLVEVSDTTLRYDREEKIPAYGRAGVPEVWIVDLNEARVEVYREPNFTGYGSRSIFEPGDTIAPQAFPSAVIQVAELFGR